MKVNQNIWKTLYQFERSLEEQTSLISVQNIYVGIYDHIKKEWMTIAGHYKLTNIHGRSHWLQKYGTNAIWYDDNDVSWRLGEEADIGSSTSKLQTTQGTAAKAQPYEITSWKYFDPINSIWTQSKDIAITKGNIMLMEIFLRLSNISRHLNFLFI